MQLVAASDIPRKLSNQCARESEMPLIEEGYKAVTSMYESSSIYGFALLYDTDLVIR